MINKGVVQQRKNYKIEHGLADMDLYDKEGKESNHMERKLLKTMEKAIKNTMEQIAQKQEDKKAEVEKEKDQEKTMPADNDSNIMLTKELLAILINGVQGAQGTGINMG